MVHPEINFVSKPIRPLQLHPCLGDRLYLFIVPVFQFLFESQFTWGMMLTLRSILCPLKMFALLFSQFPVFIHVCFLFCKDCFIIFIGIWETFAYKGHLLLSSASSFTWSICKKHSWWLLIYLTEEYLSYILSSFRI